MATAHGSRSGVLIICLALVADAIIGNYQEKIMKTHHVPNVEIVGEAALTKAPLTSHLFV